MVPATWQTTTAAPAQHETAQQDETAQRDGTAYAGWGDPSRRPGLPPHALSFLAGTVGLGAPSRPVPLDQVRVPAAALPPAVRAELVALLGPAAVADDAATRVRHAAGRSYLDLLALRSGAPREAPDAVLLPADPAQVAAVLAVCQRARVAVVPWGGGTSVVGGVRPERGSAVAVVALDLRRLDRLLHVDPVSRTAVLEAGVRAPRADALLAGHGLALGHLPQSYEQVTLGGCAATRSAGQASTGHGRFDEMVVGLVLQTPAGELRVGRGAPSAAGPSLLGLALGSEGAYGVITEVTVRVRPLPEVQRYEGLSFRGWDDGLGALRQLVQDGVAPDVVRLCDPAETRVQQALAGPGGPRARAGRALLDVRGHGAGCLAVVGWSGSRAAVAARRRAARPVLRGHGALRLGTGVGERWARGRYAAPYLRDDLLDHGLLVETLETAAPWSRLEAVRAAVRAALEDALRDTPPAVLCHVSHLYPHAASLYVTVLARQSSDPYAQWQRAKAAASAAVVASGATITHHHAVGTDHRDFLPAEVGPLGVEVLTAVKAVLDPTGILNPGTLLP